MRPNTPIAQLIFFESRLNGLKLYNSFLEIKYETFFQKNNVISEENVKAIRVKKNFIFDKN